VLKTENVGIIFMKSSSDRVNQIQTGLLGANTNCIRYSNVGVRFTGPVPNSDVLDKAIQSANRPPKNSVHRWLKRYFLIAQFRWYNTFLDRHSSALVMVWNGIKGHRSLLVHSAKQLGRRVVFLEEAPLPGRVTIDSQGVNYGSSIPRNIGFYHRWAEESGIDEDHWREVSQELVPRTAEKREDVKQLDASENLGDEPYIFCPLQVPGDSQITIYGDWVDSLDHMLDILSEAAERLPLGWHIRIKEHPSARVSFGEKLGGLACDRIRIDNDTNTMHQVAHAQAVLTINSSVGLQAFYFNKPVIVLGQAFYGFKPLTTKVSSASQLGSLIADPSQLSFNQSARNAFMNYLDVAYYPKEVDVIEGRFTLDDLIRRDQNKQRILRDLDEQ
jgi:capsular polysaccharide export protein